MKVLMTFNVIFLCILLSGCAKNANLKANGEDVIDPTSLNDSNKRLINKNRNETFSSDIRELIKSAENGNRDSQFDLGVMYKNGDRVTKDYNEAQKWLRMAAEQGNTLAQFNLGIIYKNGLGVTKDYNEAKKWLEKASSSGDKNAKLSLNTMVNNGDKEQKTDSSISDFYVQKEVKDNTIKKDIPKKISDVVVVNVPLENCIYYNNEFLKNKLTLTRDIALSSCKMAANGGDKKAKQILQNLESTVPSIVKVGKALVCQGSSGYTNRNIIYVNCDDKVEFLNALKNTWLLIRSSSKAHALGLDQDCWERYHDALDWPPSITVSKGIAYSYFLACNVGLEFVK